MTDLHKNELIKGLIGNFKSQGLEIVYADHEDFKKPDPIKGKRPDVIAWDPKKELYHIGSAADTDEFKPAKIGDKLNVLSNLMMSKGRSTTERIPFYLGVAPKTSQKITKILDEENISQDNIKTLEVEGKID